jgi:hypothetical protein
VIPSPRRFALIAIPDQDGIYLFHLSKSFGGMLLLHLRHQPSMSQYRRPSCHPLQPLRMADEDTNLKFQQTLMSLFRSSSSGADIFCSFSMVYRPISRYLRLFSDRILRVLIYSALDALPVQEREAVNAICGFSSSSHPRRELVFQGLLTMRCFSQLSLGSSVN